MIHLESATCKAVLNQQAKMLKVLRYPFMIITLTNAMDALTNPIDDSLMIQTETGKVQNMDLVNKKKHTITHHQS
jgi:hypothetical protein